MAKLASYFMSDEIGVSKRKFSLRLLFYLVTVSAISSAIIAPAIRAVGTKGYTSIIKLTAVQAILFAAVAAWTINRRKSVLRDAGLSRSYMPGIQDTALLSMLNATWKVIPLFTLQAGLIWLQLSSSKLLILFTMNIWFVVAQMVTLGLAAEAIVSVILGIDQLRVEICPNGYIHAGYQFQTWRDLIAVEPAKHSDALILTTIASDKFSMETHDVKVWPNLRDQTISEMRRRLKDC